MTSAIEFLYSLEHFGIKFGLENIRAILAALDHPERAFQSAHIAGTNGKGSVTAMVETALRAAGHRSARYTSPHLVDLTERFVVNGQPVDEASMIQSIDRVRLAIDTLRSRGVLDVHPTFFEVTTAVAFDIFRSAAVEVAVCEVGLGGRLDATNVLSPMVTAITSIAFDHQQYLGNTLAEIAVEKGGIIKPDVPIVVGALPPEAAHAIEEIARTRQAPLIRAHEGTHVELVGDGQAGGQTIRLRTPQHDYGRVELRLAGRHQIDNAIVAVRVLECLDAAGLRVAPRAIADGLTSVHWRGRLEHLRIDDRRTLLLDAAHNPAGARALAEYLGHQRAKSPLVFAAMRDKDVRGILAALAPHVSDLVLTRATNLRSADPRELATVASTVAPDVPVHLETSVSGALNHAWQLSPHVVVAGSIFLLGDVIKELRRT